MSGVIDVGDGFELTFNSATGATVEATWLFAAPGADPEPVFSDVAVAESPAGSGRFPYTFLPDQAGLWRADFRASGAANAFEQYWVRALTVTGPAPLAVLGEVTAQMPLTTAQEGIASWLLRTASALVRSRYPVDAQITAGRLDPIVVALGVVNMVLRVLRNPEGLRSKATGPFSRAFDTTAAAGLLVITADDASNFTPAPVANASAWAVGSARMMTPGLVPPPSSCSSGYGRGAL